MEFHKIPESRTENVTVADPSHFTLLINSFEHAVLSLHTQLIYAVISFTEIYQYFHYTSLRICASEVYGASFVCLFVSLSVLERIQRRAPGAAWSPPGPKIKLPANFLLLLV